MAIIHLMKNKIRGAGTIRAQLQVKILRFMVFRIEAARRRGGVVRIGFLTKYCFWYNCITYTIQSSKRSTDLLDIDL